MCGVSGDVAITTLFDGENLHIVITIFGALVWDGGTSLTPRHTATSTAAITATRHIRSRTDVHRGQITANPHATRCVGSYSTTDGRDQRKPHTRQLKQHRRGYGEWLLHIVNNFLGGHYHTHRRIRSRTKTESRRCGFIDGFDQEGPG